MRAGESQGLWSAGSLPGPGGFLNVFRKRPPSGARNLEAGGRFCQGKGFEGARGVRFLRPELGAAAAAAAALDLREGRGDRAYGRLSRGPRGAQADRRRSRALAAGLAKGGRPGGGGAAGLGGKPSPAGARPPAFAPRQVDAACHHG